MFFGSKKSKNIFLVIYIFLLLYAPPIIKNINTLLIVFLVTSLVLFFKYRTDAIEFLKKKEMKKIALLFIGYFSWYMISILLNLVFYKKFYIDNIITNLYSMGLVIPITLVCVLFILIYAKKNDISFNNLIKLTIYAGAIQGIICLLSFLFPQIKEFLLNLLYYLTDDKVFINKYHVSRRFFGYSNGMVDSFGFGSGILACLPLFYCLFSSKKYLLFVPLLLLITILNSRTGLVIFGIGFVIWFIYLFRKKRIEEYKNILLISIILCITILSLVYVIKPLTIKWIITDFMSFFTDDKFGTADILFSNRFWRLPSPFRVIIGAGFSVAGFGGISDILGFSSDVGYINEIWRTGLIGMSILIFTIFYICYLLVKKYKSKFSYLFVFFLISLLIGNIKLVIFIYNPGIVVILMFVLYELAFNEKEIKKNKQELKIYSKNQNKKISVIVPVYNVEDYLSECIESLINQTYKNLEIILINDGSKDNSLEICKSYAKKDERIVLINKENEGQAIARNYGLEIATGDYIGFVDSDDFIDLDTYDYLYSLIRKHKADCSFINIRKSDYDFQVSKYKEKLFKDDDILVEYLNHGMKTGEYSLCSYLFNKKMLAKLRFPEGRINEDIPFIYSALDNANLLVKSNKFSYNYRMSQNSTTRNYFTKRDFDLIKACDDLTNYSKNKSLKIQKLVKEKRDRSDFSLLAKIAYYGVSNEEEFQEEIKIMKKNIRKNYFELLKTNMNLVRKIQLTFFVINYDFSKKLITLVKKVKGVLK